LNKSVQTGEFYTQTVTRQEMLNWTPQF